MLNQNNNNKIATHKDTRIPSKFKIYKVNSNPPNNQAQQNNNYKRQQIT
jgi:hypothetical protein